ncbi:hypothetical protein ACH5RR_012990 [Cinchona calisaya]|uniref:Uncharacterized protein n=1 Tax=Cinchona calisaya TaxID=153742 RepID=A0ABD3A045_9GENT
MIENALTAGTSGLSSRDKEVILTLITTAFQKNKENENPKSAPSAQENPSSGIMEALTTSSTDNGANRLSNEALDFAPAEDFHPGSQGVGMKTLEVIGFPENARGKRKQFCQQILWILYLTQIRFLSWRCLEKSY